MQCPSFLQVEELRIRLAQFRRQLPRYGRGAVPKRGVHLTGPFRAPTEWSPLAAAAAAAAAEDDSDGRSSDSDTPLKQHELTKTSPQGYLEWVKQIPLAKSASHAPLAHMAPRKGVAFAGVRSGKVRKSTESEVSQAAL